MKRRENLKKIKARVVVFSILALIIALLAMDYVSKIQLKDDEGYKRFQKCEEIVRSISKEDLIKVLGEPKSIEKMDAGIVYKYEAAAVAAGPIGILLNKDQTQVIGAKCEEDSDWRIF
jgi:hypothetical protein